MGEELGLEEGVWWVRDASAEACTLRACVEDAFVVVVVVVVCEFYPLSVEVGIPTFLVSVG